MHCPATAIGGAPTTRRPLAATPSPSTINQRIVVPTSAVRCVIAEVSFLRISRDKALSPNTAICSPKPADDIRVLGIICERKTETRTGLYWPQCQLHMLD